MAKTKGAIKLVQPNAAQPTLGEAIRARRLRAKLRLIDLARRSDVSVSYISQVEHDRICPSIVALGRIAKGLEATVAAIFAEVDGTARRGPSVVNRTQRKKLIYPNSEVRNELLVSDLQGALQVMWSRIPPGEKSPIFQHDGEECGVILSGTLTYWVGDEKFSLRSGDAISHSSNIPHWYENLTKQTVQTIWIVTPPGF